jgi:hypothetical protein
MIDSELLKEAITTIGQLKPGTLAEYMNAGSLVVRIQQQIDQQAAAQAAQASASGG